MSAIVELREMSDKQINELLENSREEMFNLRFQLASARLEDISRIKKVRREIARLETVLRMRDLAIETALKKDEVVSALTDQEWFAEASFSYLESAYAVTFSNENGDELVSTSVDLNKKQDKGRKARRSR